MRRKECLEEELQKKVVVSHTFRKVFPVKQAKAARLQAHLYVEEGSGGHRGHVCAYNSPHISP